MVSGPVIPGVETGDAGAGGATAVSAVLEVLEAESGVCAQAARAGPVSRIKSTDFFISGLVLKVYRMGWLFHFEIKAISGLPD